MTQTHHVHDDMPAEIDCAKGRRGKFYRPGTRLHLPVYLDDPIQTRLAAVSSRYSATSSKVQGSLPRRSRRAGAARAHR
jgi:hypothetical protein